jgi:hypothetical protein
VHWKNTEQDCSAAVDGSAQLRDLVEHCVICSPAQPAAQEFPRLAAAERL